MFLSNKLTFNFVLMIILTAVIEFFFNNSKHYLTYGLSFATFMALSMMIPANYELYKKPNYKSIEFTPKFSKWEIILKISAMFSVKISNNILFIEDMNSGIEFLENGKIFVIGSKKHVNKLEKLLSADIVDNWG